MAAQVSTAFHPGEAATGQQVADLRRLVVAMLQQQPTTRQQMRGGALDDLADIVEAVVAGHQGAGRLEAHIALAQVRILGADVGRIADDEGETLLAQGGEPVALQETHIAQLEACTVAFGQLHGGGNAIDAASAPK